MILELFIHVHCSNNQPVISSQLGSPVRSILSSPCIRFTVNGRHRETRLRNRCTQSRSNLSRRYLILTAGSHYRLNGKAIGHLETIRQADIVSLVVIITPLQCSLIVQITYRQTISCLIRTSGNTQIMLCRAGSSPKNIRPVYIIHKHKVIYTRKRTRYRIRI